MAPRREIGGVLVEDRWTQADGEPSSVDGRGKRWRVRWTDPSGKQRSRSFTRKVDARKHADELTTDLTRGAYVDRRAGLTTVGEVYQRFQPLQVQLKPSSRARQEGLWATHLQPRWGTVPVSAVTRPDVQGWAADLLDADGGPGLSPSSVRQAVGLLRQVMAHAVEDGRLSANPAERIRLPSPRPSRNVYLSVGQVEAVARAAARTVTLEYDGDQDDGDGWEPYAVLVRLLSYTGLRWGEAVALRVEDVALPADGAGRLGRLDVHRTDVVLSGKRSEGTPKDHRRRSVPVPAPLVEGLRGLLVGRAPTDRVFTTPGGAPIDSGNFRARVWSTALDSVAGVPDGLRVHDLRHTAASLSIRSGASVKAVQRMLGHATATMTLDVYADLFPDDLDDVARRVGDVIERDT